MPHYFNFDAEINRHCREHYSGRYIENKRLLYCKLCYPILQGSFIPGFTNFWYWIRDRYAARTYTGFTRIAFEQLNNSINSGDTALTNQLIFSITFNRLVISVGKTTYVVNFIKLIDSDVFTLVK